MQCCANMKLDKTKKENKSNTSNLYACISVCCNRMVTRMVIISLRQTLSIESHQNDETCKLQIIALLERIYEILTALLSVTLDDGVRSCIHTRIFYLMHIWFSIEKKKNNYCTLLWALATERSTVKITSWIFWLFYGIH